MKAQALWGGLLWLFGAAGAPFSGDQPMPSEHGVHLYAMPPLTVEGVFSAVVGQAPGAAHPRGTMILARPLKGRGLTLTEWDLSRGSAIRNVQLGWPQTWLALARSGNVLHLVAAGEPANVVYATLDVDTFSVTKRQIFGPGGFPAVATDGNLTVVSYTPADKVAGVHLGFMETTFDADGHVLARGQSTSQNDYSLRRPVIVNGHIYALVAAIDGPYDLVEMSPLLVVEKRIHLHDLFPQMPLAPTRGHLLVGTMRGFDEYTLDLDFVAHYERKLGEAVFTVSETGLIATACGDVFPSPSEFPIATFSADCGWDEPLQPLWVGETPVLFHVSNDPGWAGDFEWLDLSDSPRMRQRVPSRADGGAP